MKEASRVRVLNLSPVARVFSFLWEVPSPLITYLAGSLLSSDFYARLSKVK